MVSDTLNLDPQFERSVVACMVRSGNFYAILGVHTRPEQFPTKIYQEILCIVKDFHADTGRGPGGTDVILQRIKNQILEGKYTFREYSRLAAAVKDLDAVVYEEESIQHELSSIVQSRKNHELLEKAIDAAQKQQPLSGIAAEMLASASIGVQDLSLADGIDTLAADIANSGLAERLSFGCPQLDAHTGGGRKRGEFGFYLAPAKTGKSMALVGDAVTAVRSGYNTLAITVELSSEQWRARFLSGLTGTPLQEVELGSPLAFERYAEVKQAFSNDQQKLGKFGVKHLKPGTTLPEIFDFIARQEAGWGEPVEVLIIDYLDRLGGTKPHESPYLQMLELYEGTRLWAEKNNRWAITASQTKTHVGEGQMPGLSDAADSQNKVRVTDWMVGLSKVQIDNRGVGIEIKLVAGRNYPESEKLGPYAYGREYGVLYESTALDPTGLLKVLEKESKENIAWPV